MKILVSACLLGEKCRYDGQSKPCPRVMELSKKHELIPVCPECAGGLPTPRIPAEITGGKVLRKDGTDVTSEYRKGAEKCLEKAKNSGVTAAILKERSPACGKGLIHDGSFTGALTEGNGVFADLLIKNNIKVYGETEAFDFEND